MGFIHDIRKILSFLPKYRQNLLFSATFSNEIRKLAKTMVHEPVEISVTPRNTTAETVKQWICPVDKKRKPELLAHLIHANKWDQVLVFSRTKHGADRLVKQLDKNQITAVAIHGNKSQGARTRALAAFKKSNVRVLVATDIAARGIDINQLPQVVNFDLPNVPEDYVHRIGRTGRAGESGQAVSLVSADEIKQLKDIERLIGRILERRLIDGFEPDHDLPASNMNAPKKPGKTVKRPNQGSGANNGSKKPQVKTNFRNRNKNKQRQGTQKKNG
jgi:ATP-dependent RNA helicase RhlE